MSKTNIEDLKKIANALKQKLSFINKNQDPISQKAGKAIAHQEFQMNSDSERQALELFDNVKPAKEKNGQENKSQPAATQIIQSNIKSILRQKIPTEEEVIEELMIPESDSESDKQSEKEKKAEKEKKEKKAKKAEKAEKAEKDEKDEKEDKKLKSVSFNFDENLIFSLNPDRKWNQKIENQKKGKFEHYEQKALGDAIGQYIVTNEISFDQFVKWLSMGSKEEKHILRKEKFFKLLSSVLPNRSPQSCYKFVLRNYNSLNHQGNWTAEEVEKLKGLVEKFGRKWTIIAKQLGRTSDNVYDKYRSIGEEGLQDRIQGLWKIREMVTMLLEIQRQTEIQFIDHNIKKVLEKEVEHDGIEQTQFRNHRYNSKLFTFHNIEVIRKYIDCKLFQGIELNNLKWKRIVKEVKTKNMFDCRNKIVQILQVLFRNNESLDEGLLKFLVREKPKEESKINWKKWSSEGYTPEQAKNRFMILKKLVEGRTTKPFPKIYQQMIVKITKILEKPKAA